MPAKRPNGTGSVYRRKDGRWVAAVSIDGKRFTRYGKTKKEAKAKLNKLLSDSPQPAPNMPEDVTLREWTERWLGLRAESLRPSTRNTYRDNLALVTKLVGNTKLRELTALRLAETFSELERQGRGRRRLYQTHTVLKQCLKQAWQFELIDANPMDRVPKPRWQQQERRYWTIEQTSQFVRTALATERKWGPLFAVLATTGLRFSEAIGLRWSDVDWNAGTVRVEQTVVWSHGEFHILPPKTKAGRRTVSLTRPAVRALRRLEHDCSPETRIFRTETGAPPRHSDIRLFLHDLCDEAGVPRINIHGLRHVAAMLAFEAVDDIYLVQQRLGHSHVGVTLAVYGYPARNESVVAPEIDRLLDL